MVADWRSPLADCFRANQIRPISLAVFIKIFFRCSLTEKRSLLISMERTMFIAPGLRSPAAFQIPTIPGWFWLTADTTKSLKRFQKSRAMKSTTTTFKRTAWRFWTRQLSCSLLRTAADQIHSHIRSRSSCCRRRRQQLRKSSYCLPGRPGFTMTRGMLLITWLAHRLA